MVIHSLSKKELEKLFEKSRISPRRRAVKIFQEDSYSGPHIGLNVIQPDSYVRPHLRYSDESIIHYSGTLCSLLFNSEGNITHRALISRQNPYFLLPKETFHSVVSLEEDSAIWFITQGPFNTNIFRKDLPNSPTEEGDYQKYFNWLKEMAKKLSE